MTATAPASTAVPGSRDARAWTDIHFSARDGLRLYARRYAAPGALRRPVLCLPGLTRNSRDFHDLAQVLADPKGHRREVFALDSRGRGGSGFDTDPRNYNVRAELDDVLDFMTVVSLTDAAIIGTSRGGLIAMAIAAARPAAIGAVVLNDIGPVIERDGLVRIIAYVGRVPLPATWPEAASLLRGMSGHQFPELTAAMWQALARQVFNDVNGRPAPGYDPRMGEAIALGDGPLPPLWPQFAALARVPMLAIRGANSDILSAATLAEMARRHPRFASHTVAGEGHAPLLWDAASIGAISDFLIATDPPAAHAAVLARTPA